MTKVEIGQRWMWCHSECSFIFEIVGSQDNFTGGYPGKILQIIKQWYSPFEIDSIHNYDVKNLHPWKDEGSFFLLNNQDKSE